MKVRFLFIASIIVVASVYAALGMASIEATSSKKVAVVLFNFQNDQTQPYTPDYARSMFDTINKFYLENSFGKFAFSGIQNQNVDVYGWYTISHTNAGCTYDAWSTAANQKLTSSGVNADSYDYVVYAFPRTTSCSWTGLSETGGTKSWNNGRFTLGIVAHEMGHDMGMLHANTYRCYDASGNKVSMSDNCKSFEYTDPYDIMGSGTFSTNYAAHFSGFNKGSMGWLNPSNTLTLNKSGTYNIEALEIPSNNIKVLRVPRKRDTNGNPVDYYYLEFRRPIGFDNYWRFSGSSPVSNGVTIRIAPDYSLFANTQLIDTTPDTTSFEDAPLVTGKTFVDSKNSISITALPTTTNTIGVQVNLLSTQSCARRNPSVSISPSGGLTADKTQRYTVTLKNNDDTLCGSSPFTVTATLPSQLTQTPRKVSISTLAPGKTVSFSIYVKPTLQISGGTYIFFQVAANSQVPSFSATTFGYYKAQ